jgi:UDP-glucose 4-epimerase/UDP-glucuronate decarboxylase
MPRTLILGGAGFIGHHLALRLAGEGHELTLVDDLSRGRRDLEMESLCARPNITLVQADLTRADALAGLARRWDGVYMLAAVVACATSRPIPHAWCAPIRWPSCICSTGWRPSPGVLFFASTSETYAAGVTAGTVPVPTPEDVPLSVADIRAPRFAYAASKILGEAAVIHTARARGLRAVVGRFHNVYGPRMGADHVVPSSRFARFAEQPVPALLVLTSGAPSARVGRRGGDPASDGERGGVGADRPYRQRQRGDTDRGPRAPRPQEARFEPALERAPAPPGSVARRCPDIGRLRR